MNVQKKEKGFTIIEVVLVLAIAALIFLMIFIALPALQKSQRDTSRKNDANTIASAISTYRGNNRGKLPTPATTAGLRAFVAQYVTAEGAPAATTNTASTLNQYTYTNFTYSVNDPTSVDAVNVVFGRNCAGTASTRSAAVKIRLESSNSVTCTDA